MEGRRVGGGEWKGERKGGRREGWREGGGREGRGREEESLKLAHRCRFNSLVLLI